MIGYLILYATVAAAVLCLYLRFSRDEKSRRGALSPYERLKEDLNHASLEEEKAAIKNFIKDGADINGTYGHFPLLIEMLMNEQYGAFRELLSSGANPDVQAKSGLTCVFMLIHKKWETKTCNDKFALFDLNEANANMRLTPHYMDNPSVEQAYNNGDFETAEVICWSLQKEEAASASKTRPLVSEAE